MHLTIPALEKLVDEKIANKHFDAALFAIQGFVEQVIYHPRSVGKVIGSPELDMLCQKIGTAIVEQQASNNASTLIKNDLIVYVASRLYNSGGHTAVIEDLIKYQPEKNHIILITDIFQNSHREEIAKRFSAPNTSIEIATAASLYGKTIWLYQRLQELAPAKVFLFNHHQDSVAIAALQPSLKSQLYFFHHADHHLCLGIYLPHAIHIDAQSLGFHHCRQKLQVKNNIYWPLVVPDLGKSSRSFMRQGKLTTCSSGSSVKFETPYLFSYAELIPKILVTTQGKHIHIGKLSASALQKIKQGLGIHGISENNFIHIPWVKSVWQTVIDQEVDLYLNSFPISGGRAVIEMMGAGTPIVMHENYRSEYLGQVYLAYPEAFYWRKATELLTFLPTITATWLQQQAMAARQHYENYHASELLQQAIISNSGLQPPVIPAYEADVLQTFLEEYQDLTLKNLMKKKMMNFIWRNRALVNIARAARKRILKI